MKSSTNLLCHPVLQSKEEYCTGKRNVLKKETTSSVLSAIFMEKLTNVRDLMVSLFIATKTS
eukprot:6210486-Ditylum_brightwellii.AAC.1